MWNRWAYIQIRTLLYSRVKQQWSSWNYKLKRLIFIQCNRNSFENPNITRFEIEFTEFTLFDCITYWSWKKIVECMASERKMHVVLKGARLKRADALNQWCQYAHIFGTFNSSLSIVLLPIFVDSWFLMRICGYFQWLYVQQKSQNRMSFFHNDQISNQKNVIIWSEKCTAISVQQWNCRKNHY